MERERQHPHFAGLGRSAADSQDRGSLAAVAGEHQAACVDQECRHFAHRPKRHSRQSLTTGLGARQSMYNTNFYAPLVLTRGCAQELSNARGAAVNLCLIAGHCVHRFAGSAYATSKSALAALTREMANDLALLNARVNADPIQLDLPAGHVVRHPEMLS
ncbi:SDR family NAD(P)-dependent oxidoreductase [Variovorax sp. 770b2]|uniref:SDR family NAD(P)-dependent oxidoreductase n=1 Tax=Variovorax sp. 770b2 TaxID=1566271 RepID=UPI0015A71005|nr:SDR family NAD(P)-dependent oxidoreductase [Variovorax sp. 770b2]